MYIFPFLCTGVENKPEAPETRRFDNQRYNRAAAAAAAAVTVSAAAVLGHLFIDE